MARRSEHTRQELKQLALEAAIRLANEQGLSGLTARKIATEMGYTPGTLYLIFENLDELILHVNAQTLDDIYELMQAQLQCTDMAGQGVHQLVDAYMQFATENHGLWSCLHEHKPESEKIPEWFESRISRNFNLVEHTLERANHESGENKSSSAQILKPNMTVFEINSLKENEKKQNSSSVELVARALWCAIHGVCVLALNSSLNVAGVDSMQALVHHLTDISLQSLGVADEAHSQLEVTQVNPVSYGV